MGQTSGCFIAPKENRITSLDPPIHNLDIGIAPMNHKRCIFLSMFHLNKDIQDIPAFIIEKSIFCFKMNEDDFLSTTNLNPLFLHYCKEKRDQGLFLEIKDDTTWADISRKLSDICDICSSGKTKYDALKLNHLFWTETYGENISRYMVDKDEILHELAANEFKFYPSMEIIIQSNASLVPMTSFDMSQYYGHCVNDYSVMQLSPNSSLYALNKQLESNCDEDIFCVDDDDEYFATEHTSDISISSRKDILSGFDSEASDF